jgi:hypothetical protein
MKNDFCLRVGNPAKLQIAPFAKKESEVISALRVDRGRPDETDDSGKFSRARGAFHATVHTSEPPQ